MVKVTGPALSIEAAGKLSTLLAFATTKGRTYAKHTPRPRDPKTPGQVANRAMMRFLQNAWAGLDQASKDAWLPTAAEAKISAYHAFLGSNLHRWAAGKTPSQTPTIGPPPDFIEAVPWGEDGTLSATPSGMESTAENVWGILFFRTLTETLTPDLHTAAHIAEHTFNNPTSWLDHPLPPGTYHYVVLSFTNDGHHQATAPYDQMLISSD